MYQLQLVMHIFPTDCAKLLIDRSIFLPLTFSYGTGTLPDPHETDGHGTQLVEGSRGNTTAQRHSVGKLRSKLWKEFEILEFDQNNGAPVRAECKHCKTKLNCPTKQGTGVLQNHLKSKSCPYDPLRYPKNLCFAAPEHFQYSHLYICLKVYQGSHTKSTICIFFLQHR
jgi:hypothetical protein